MKTLCLLLSLFCPDTRLQDQIEQKAMVDNYYNNLMSESLQKAIEDEHKRTLFDRLFKDGR